MNETIQGDDPRATQKMLSQTTRYIANKLSDLDELAAGGVETTSAAARSVVLEKVAGLLRQLVSNGLETHVNMVNSTIEALDKKDEELVKLRSDLAEANSRLQSAEGKAAVLEVKLKELLPQPTVPPALTSPEPIPVGQPKEAAE